MSRRIRRAHPGEVQLLAALDAQADSHPWHAAQISTALTGRAGQDVLALGSGGQVDGFVVFALGLDEGSIHRVVVASALRRHGLGRQLVEAALAKLRSAGARRCVLEVRQSNWAARALYRQAGFLVDGRRPGYYARREAGAGREDAVLMSLLLES